MQYGIQIVRQKDGLDPVLLNYDENHFGPFDAPTAAEHVLRTKRWSKIEGADEEWVIQIGLGTVIHAVIEKVQDPSTRKFQCVDPLDLPESKDIPG
jgi:hypothetical protein